MGKKLEHEQLIELLKKIIKHHKEVSVMKKKSYCNTMSQLPIASTPEAPPSGGGSDTRGCQATSRLWFFKAPIAFTHTRACVRACMHNSLLLRVYYSPFASLWRWWALQGQVTCVQVHNTFMNACLPGDQLSACWDGEVVFLVCCFWCSVSKGATQQS